MKSAASCVRTGSLVAVYTMTLCGCVASPERIAPKPVASDPYLHMTCDQLVEEQDKTQRNLADEEREQRSVRRTDAWGVAILFLPLGRMSGGNREDEISELKGDAAAIDAAFKMERCVDVRMSATPPFRYEPAPAPPKSTLTFRDTATTAGAMSAASTPVSALTPDRSAFEAAGDDSTAPVALPAGTGGATDRVRLGVHCVQVTALIAQADHLPVQTGVRVATVEAGSVAEASGIKVGDVLLKYGDRSVNEIADLTNAIAATTKGASIPVTVARRTGEAVVDVHF
jgi:hypothetical protein